MASSVGSKNKIFIVQVLPRRLLEKYQSLFEIRTSKLLRYDSGDISMEMLSVEISVLSMKISMEIKPTERRIYAILISPVICVELKHLSYFQN